MTRLAMMTPPLVPGWMPMGVVAPPGALIGRTSPSLVTLAAGAQRVHGADDIQAGDAAGGAAGPLDDDEVAGLHVGDGECGDAVAGVDGGNEGGGDATGAEPDE